MWVGEKKQVKSNKNRTQATARGGVWAQQRKIFSESLERLRVVVELSILHWGQIKKRCRMREQVKWRPQNKGLGKKDQSQTGETNESEIYNVEKEKRPGERGGKGNSKGVL